MQKLKSLIVALTLFMAPPAIADDADELAKIFITPEILEIQFESLSEAIPAMLAQALSQELQKPVPAVYFQEAVGKILKVFVKEAYPPLLKHKAKLLRQNFTSDELQKLNILFKDDLLVKLTGLTPYFSKEQSLYGSVIGEQIGLKILQNSVEYPDIHAALEAARKRTE